MVATPVILKSLPGIKRDGTQFEGDNYIDGQWVRFQRGLPRKIGGYASVNNYLTEISRGVFFYSSNALIYSHTGSKSLLERFTLDVNGNASASSNRTPAGFVIDDNNVWMFDNLYNSSSTANTIVAHVAPNLASGSNTTGGNIYSGDLFGTGALTAVTPPVGGNVSGGVVVLHPYLFAFGGDGNIAWAASGTTDFAAAGSGIVRATGQKIVKGIPLRGGSGASPAGLFWSLDSVIRATFVGGSAVFQFDTLSTQGSIISPNSVIDYDGIYFWCAVDRFMMFNGVVREVPNNMNVNWFFDNINKTYAQKVFAVKYPRWGEIWWHFPFGDATECTHAVIYNVRENTWYDTELPNGGRSAGAFTQEYANPLLTGVEEGNFGYTLWRHDYGVNEVNGVFINSIPSYFETADISFIAQQGANKVVRCSMIEPDFVQAGEMSMQITGRANARAKNVEGDIRTFPETATSVGGGEQVIELQGNNQRREFRLKFSSNVIDGDYQMGQIIAHFEPGDGTYLGPNP